MSEYVNTPTIEDVLWDMAHEIYADAQNEILDGDYIVAKYADKLREVLRDEWTCECIAEYAKSPIDGKTIVLHRCSSCHELMRPHMNYCPNCGAKRREDNA